MSEKNIALDCFMANVHPINTIKTSEKTEIQTVLYGTADSAQSVCILRICKNRDLSSVYEALSHIKSPNLTVVYDYVYANGNTYVLEEQLNGETVEARLKREGVFSKRETARIIAQVCDGLALLHKQKPPIVHNDIKPENIMLCDDGTVKVFDFDISRTVKTESSQNTQLIATVEYASPEQFGFGQSDPRSDIFCLGGTMIAMLTGEPPSNDYKRPYKGALQRIISKCRQNDPRRRYHSVNSLKKDLQNSLNRGVRWLLYLGILFCIAMGIYWGSGGFSELPALFNAKSNFSAETFDGTSTMSSAASTTMVTDAVSTATSTTSHSITENTVKKMTVVEGLTGELIALTSRKDGTFVYAENIGDSITIKTSTGKQALLPFSLDEFLGLVYNPHRDTFYAIVKDPTNSDVRLIYGLDEMFTPSASPLYSATRSTAVDCVGLFYSDGTMYCNMFKENIIDTKKWLPVSKISQSPDAILKDRLYQYQNEAFYEEGLNQRYNDCDGTRVDVDNHAWCPYGDVLYVKTFPYSGDDYIYTFDGDEFKQVVCLNDYQYYESFNANAMAASDTEIWLYNAETNCIVSILL